MTTAPVLDRARFALENSARRGVAILLALLSPLGVGKAALMPPEKLIPENAVALVTVRDYRALATALGKLPEVQAWKDDALKPFRDKFLVHWREDFVQPLERELQTPLAALDDFRQGQLTFAWLPAGEDGHLNSGVSWLFLLEARDHSDSLRTNLATLRKRWGEAGKALRTEKIRENEFMVLALSSNDLPKTLAALLPYPLELHELGVPTPPKPASRPHELIIGQVDSLLLVSDSPKIAEKVVTRVAGGAVPTLADRASFDADYQAYFRNAPAYAWVNAEVLVEELKRRAASRPEDSSIPSPAETIPAGKWIAGSGLGGLETAGLTVQGMEEGLMIRLFLRVPEAKRQGVFRILEGVPKECQPPPFVPAEAVKFRRWRLDGPKSFANLAKILADLSPPALRGLQFVLETAGARAKELEPGYDLRGSLLGNWGDDVISYERAPREAAPAEMSSRPELYLIGSTNSEQLAAALKALFVILPGGDSGTQREFLGHKVFSVPLPANSTLPLPGISGSSGSATLHYAAAGGYVALSTDGGMVEEYLRSSETPSKALRELPGLADATQKVAGPGTFVFGYENRAEVMRELVESIRRNAASGTNGPLVIPGMSRPDKSVLDWMDFSLIPPFERLAKYFHFVVYGGSTTVNGLTFSLFVPAHPAVKE